MRRRFRGTASRAPSGTGLACRRPAAGTGARHRAQARSNTVDRLEEIVAGPRMEGNTLPDDVAYQTLDTRASSNWRRGFLLVRDLHPGGGLQVAGRETGNPGLAGTARSPPKPTDIIVRACPRSSREPPSPSGSSGSSASRCLRWPPAPTPRSATPEPDSEHRTPFQRDRDRIVHSKAFRRLKHKTQVFIAPEGDHYRTRLTHTLEASGSPATWPGAGPQRGPHRGDLARPRPRPPALRPHRGGGARRVRPRALGERLSPQRAFTACGGEDRGAQPHRARCATGIRHHTGPERPQTLEGRIVRVVDRIAYINHDIDDAIRAGVLRFEELPQRGDRAARLHGLGADRDAGGATC